MPQRCGDEDMGSVLKGLSIKTSAQSDFKFSENRAESNLSLQRHSASYKKELALQKLSTDNHGGKIILGIESL